MAGIDPEKVVSGRTLCEGRAFADAGGWSSPRRWIRSRTG